MFRPLKKKKNAISMEEAKKLLKTERRGVIAVNGDDGYPYAVPVNFFYDEETEKIYFHGNRKGYKVDSLKKCDKVCFTVYGNEKIGEESWAPYMQSTVVFGRCRLMENNDEMFLHLRKFAMKYYPSEEAAEQVITEDGRAVQLFEITIEHMSGKQVQER